MTARTFRGGRAAPQRWRPRVRLADHIDTAALPEIPAVRDWVTGAGVWPMDANDKWGDCVWAEIGHHIQACAWFGQTAQIVPSEADILRAYSEVTGFDPNAGPPGRNATDQGTVMQDAQEYWRKTGVAGHKSLAFAEVDHANVDEVCAAIDLFGAVSAGINFPAIAMDQFDAGHAWDVVPNDGGIEGGHAIMLGGYDKNRQVFLVITWGKVIEMTFAFWRKYGEEAWATIVPEWFAVSGRSPVGLDLYGLGQAFALLADTTNPFPAPAPAPTPPPQPAPPAPAPTPAPDPALEAALVSVVEDADVLEVWARRRHSGATRLVAEHVLALLRALR